jgi:hypothetical protein
MSNLHEEEYMEQQEAYEKDMNIKMKKWGAKIDEMKARLDTADAQTRQSLYREIENLRELQHKAQDHIESLKHSGRESFNDVKVGVENAVKKLEEAVGSALSRFK